MQGRERITGTPAQRRVAKWGCLIAAGALLLLIALVFLLPDEGGSDRSKNSSPVSAPTVRLDTAFLPVLNVDLQFGNPSYDPELVEAVAQAVKAVGDQLVSSEAEGRSLTAVNFVATANQADGVRRPLLHFTIRADALLTAAKSDRLPGAFLNLAGEAGANSLEVEKAVREYCAGASTPFCQQVLN